MKLLASLLIAVILPIPLPSPEPPTHPPPGPVLGSVRLLALGDSQNLGDAYRPELDRLLTRAGQPHTWAVNAAPGSKCSWWVPLIDSLITLHDPDIIFLNCGTNDTPSDDTEADYRAILARAAVHSVPVVASLIGRPYMGSAENADRPWIDEWMFNTNQAIKRALAGSPATPVADLQSIPATPEWLNPDGIHFGSRAYIAWAQLFYEAARVLRGWPSMAVMRVSMTCGLSGAPRGAPWPAPGGVYRVCTN